MNWRVKAKPGPAANFFQPDGTSKPGVEWMVEIRGNESHAVLVRAYADDTANLSAPQQNAVVVAFIINLLKTGWHPANYKGEPGELTLKVTE